MHIAICVSICTKKDRSNSNLQKRKSSFKRSYRIASILPCLSKSLKGLLSMFAELVANYFMDRYHTVKLGHVKSDCLKVPQGSVIGPFAYNVHCNDLIVTLEDMCEIFNYPDDNTVTCHSTTDPDVRKRQKLLLIKC